MNQKIFNIYNMLVLFPLIAFTISPIQGQKNNNTIFEGIDYLSQFIASDYFVELKKVNSDLDLVDTLFSHSLKFHNNDISDALLSLTFATLPYNEIPMIVPIINLRLSMPLPSTDEPIFLKKLKNLPKHFLFDSRTKGSSGDKDKLSHFFGNAFISYNIGIFNVSKFMSILVEMFEYTFKVEGNVDFRDMKIDELGEIFGTLLKSELRLIPSKILSTQYLLNINFNL